nr:hypothetical protein [Microbacterium testaceum]
MKKTFNPASTLVGQIWLNGLKTDQMQKGALDVRELTEDQYELLNTASNIHRKLVDAVLMLPSVPDVAGLTELLFAADMAVNKSLSGSHQAAGTFEKWGQK